MKNNFLLTVVLILPGLLFAYADSEETNAPLIRVNIAMTDDDLTEGKLYNCLTRELKKFEDIKIVLDNADWKLDLITSKLPARGSGDQDYAFSLVFLKLGEDGKYAMAGHELMTGYLNLQTACRDIDILFAKKYLQKDPKGIIDPYQ